MRVFLDDSARQAIEHFLVRYIFWNVLNEFLPLLPCSAAAKEENLRPNLIAQFLDPKCPLPQAQTSRNFSLGAYFPLFSPSIAVDPSRAT